MLARAMLSLMPAERLIRMTDRNLSNLESLVRSRLPLGTNDLRRYRRWIERVAATSVGDDRQRMHAALALSGIDGLSRRVPRMLDRGHSADEILCCLTYVLEDYARRRSTIRSLPGVVLTALARGQMDRSELWFHQNEGEIEVADKAQAIVARLEGRMDVSPLPGQFFINGLPQSDDYRRLHRFRADVAFVRIEDVETARGGRATA